MRTPHGSPPRSKIELTEGTSPQAARIIAVFGSPYRMSAALKAVGVARSPAAIYRWTYAAAAKGRGGIVPPNLWQKIADAAALLGCDLNVDRIAAATSAEWSPVRAAVYEKQEPSTRDRLKDMM